MSKKGKFFKQIGEMKKRILIQEYSETKGRTGGVSSVAWTTICEIWSTPPIDKPGQLNIVIAGRPITTDRKIFASRFKPGLLERNQQKLGVVYPATGNYRKRYYVKTISSIENEEDFMAILCHTHNAENVI
jgi:hypothetical protein